MSAAVVLIADPLLLFAKCPLSKKEEGDKEEGGGGRLYCETSENREG